MKNVKKYERLFLAFILLLLAYPLSTIQASETRYSCLYGERGELTDCLYSDGTNQKFNYDINGNLINKYSFKNFTNIQSAWQSKGGKWLNSREGLSGQGSNNVYYMSGDVGSDFTYEGDIKLTTSGAGALVFRANTDATQGYVVNVDTGGIVRLWQIGEGAIKDYPSDIKVDQVYHLKVVAAGSSIKVYFNNEASPVIDVNHTALTSGHFGLNVYNSAVVFQNVVAREGFSNLTGMWNPIGGSWTETTQGKQGQSRNGEWDVFYLNTQTGGDFTYEGDIKLTTSGAGALVFRANTDATQGYVVNVDTGGIVRLWQIGEGAIKDYPADIKVGQVYHLKIVAAGSSIKIYFNNGASPVIDVNHTALTSGYFGVNVCNGQAIFKNINYGVDL